MTSSAAPTPAKRTSVPNIFRDLVFTLVIPTLILTPNLLGSGITVSELLGGDTTGNIRTYLLAAFVPVVYVLWDVLINRNLSPVALLGGAGALVNGALVFWYVDGFWYAVKHSARPFLTALLSFASATTAYPLFRIFLEATTAAESPLHRNSTKKALRAPPVVRALARASVVFGMTELVSGVVNSVVSYHIVLAKFGTTAFNTQVARANLVTRAPDIAIGLVGLAVAFWLVQRAVTARYGAGASLLEPEKLTARLKEAGEL